MPDGFDIGQVKVEPFKISHDAVDPVGFCLYYREFKYVVATDLGTVTPEVKEALAWADAAVLEANHDLNMLNTGPYPFFLKQRIRSAVGHLSNNDSARLLADVPRKPTMQVFLAHLSQQNNHPALAEKTVSTLLSDRGCDVGHEVVLHQTFQNYISGFAK
jgi:phosphoribosyl 1,2-cyclic phosphodiesterase